MEKGLVTERSPIRKVRFDLHPTFFMFLKPVLTEEEREEDERREQMERWEDLLTRLQTTQ